MATENGGETLLFEIVTGILDDGHVRTARPHGAHHRNPGGTGSDEEMNARYDQIGEGYSLTRREDPHISRGHSECAR